MSTDRTHADVIREALDWTRDTEEYSDTLAALNALLAERDAANAQLADIRRQMEEARERGEWPLAKIVAERDAATERADLAERTERHVARAHRDAEAQLVAAREALIAIANNAEDWHGPPPDMGHVRALKVIATWARNALAASE